MRIEHLHVPAFGPFTDLRLQFSAQANDLHVIFGPNEAGKSSLLRAIRDLLFGIHGQSSDNFLHDYKNLRIRGEIVNRTGDRLIFQRRKGAKNTLLDTEGNQLPDTVLTPYMGGVDSTYFSTMFGLGARELREGAEQLLSGEGEVGKALFSASLGGTPIQKVLAALTEESERLFKGRATTNVSIRPAVARHKELLKLSRESIVNPEVWESIDKEIASAEGIRRVLEIELGDLSRELEWIGRCEDALPAVGRLNEQRRKLSELPPAPDVSSDFIERTRNARDLAVNSGAEVRRMRAQIEQLTAQRDSAVPNDSFLRNSSELERFHQDLGGFRDRTKALSERRLKLAKIEAELRLGMQSLGLPGGIEAMASLRLSSPMRMAFEEAGRRLSAITEELDANTRSHGMLQNQIKLQEQRLESLPVLNLEPLREALASAAGATEANRTTNAALAEVERLSRQVKALQGSLLSVPVDPEATAALPVPVKSTIRTFRDQFNSIRRNLELELVNASQTKNRIGILQAELERMERRGLLPSEEVLRKARIHRDTGWAQLLAKWRGGGNDAEFVAGMPLEAAVRQSIDRTDELADELIRHAEAVSQAEERRFQISQAELERQEAQKRAEVLQAELARCQSSWEDVWGPSQIPVRTPDEMEEWRDSWSEFKEILGQLRGAEEVLQRKHRQVEEANDRLTKVLVDPATKEFSLLFETAKRRVQEGEQAAGRRDALVIELQSLGEQFKAVEGDRDRLIALVELATHDWNQQCQRLGMRPDTSPASGLALLMERKELLSVFDTWSELSVEKQLLDEQLRGYRSEVDEKAVALGVEGETTESREAAMWKALVEARDVQSRHDQLADQIERLTLELTVKQLAAAQSARALDELMQVAKVDSIESLEPLLSNLESRNDAQVQAATFRDTLSGLARGEPVDAFIEHVRAEDVDGFPQRRTRLNGKKLELEARLKEVGEALLELRRRKSELEKDGDKAASYLQQAQSLATQLQVDAARYVRLRVATHLLETQIETFRKENQGPLLKRSGEVFQAITRGAFSGLGAEFNADDVPILMGIRRNQSSVPVEGMSEGTRDQLYLALRLAALDRYLEDHEPMPLILDDLLITFDDFRAGAILTQLAEMAKRTQVFLFTHHEHLVELCRHTLGDGRFQVHRLAPG